MSGGSYVATVNVLCTMTFVPLRSTLKCNSETAKILQLSVFRYTQSMQLFRNSSCIPHVTNLRAKSLENRVLFSFPRTTATIPRHSYTSPATTTIVRHSHTTPATKTPIGTLFSPINPPISTHFSIISAFPHSFSRWLSRAINIALKRRPKKVTLPRSMRLIDEQGTYLGVVSSEIAVKLAESKNLKLLEVQRAASPDSEGVYRLFTSKQQWEEGKKRKKSAKPDPINTTKDRDRCCIAGEGWL